MNELLLFHAGDRQFGVPLPLVKSIQGAKTLCEEPAAEQQELSDAECGSGEQKSDFCIHPLILSHSYVRMPEAEFPVPIYDLSAILGDASRPEASENKKVMFVSVQDHPLALKVDRVERVISVEKDRIESLSPVLGAHVLAWFPRVLKQEDNLVLLLNPGGILGIEDEYQEAEEDDLLQLREISDDEEPAGPDDSEQNLPQTEPPEEAVSEEELSLAEIRTDDFQPEDIIEDITDPECKADVHTHAGEPCIPDAEILSLSEAVRSGDIPEKTIQTQPETPGWVKPAFPDDPETLENLLTRIVKQEIVSDMILHLLTPYIEQAVEQEIGMVKKIWRKNLRKVRNEK